MGAGAEGAEKVREGAACHEVTPSGAPRGAGVVKERPECGGGADVGPEAVLAEKLLQYLARMVPCKRACSREQALERGMPKSSLQGVHVALHGLPLCATGFGRRGWCEEGSRGHEERRAQIRWEGVQARGAVGLYDFSAELHELPVYFRGGEVPVRWRDAPNCPVI